MEFEDPRRVLARHGLLPKKGFSQNFLVARPVVERIADIALERGEKEVIELGPGLGTLTAALLRRGARVIAVERDRDMIGVLRAELGTNSLFSVAYGDAGEIDFASLGPRTVVGNLPYAITGAILRNLSTQRGAIDRAVLMVQREVRDRLLAEPGTKQYGALTVFTSLAFAVRGALIVPPGAFHPPPKVTSAVVELTRRDDARHETPALRAIVRAIFDSRRKTLRNSLLHVADASEVDAALGDLAIDPRRRGETLGQDELIALSGRLVTNVER